MALFQPFNKATKRDPLNMQSAVIAEANFKQKQQAQADALRNSQMQGAAQIYNQGMGDKSPIADYLGGLGEPDIGGIETVDGSMGPDMSAGNMGTMDAGVPGMEGTAVGPAPTNLGDLGGTLNADMGSMMPDMAAYEGVAPVAEAAAPVAELGAEAGLEAAALGGGEAALAAGAGEAALGAGAMAAPAAVAPGIAAAAPVAAIPGVGQAAMAAMALKQLYGMFA